MRRALALLLLLAACGREAATPPAAAPSFRDRGQPIASTLRGTASDLAGDWVIAQSYPGLPFASPGTRVSIAVGSDASAGWSFAGPGGTERVSTTAAGQGRFVPREEGGLELWVLWVDDDFRTAVVGTPDGRFGWVMDRPGEASPDRAVAAREMLDFNGYDLSRLSGA
ncbi:lipocalin family protein [Rubellimicrobium arenae]|uniref:lipocalin family protein n=1 Tax=Rubellimicrobium arenae TaxID=2817372 RepID=UPI001B313967|nr:lipocalin family protein [Rubellimicrobium arenae]